MSSNKQDMKLETVAWVTDDEAEFWTNLSPINKYQAENGSKSDGLHFIYDDKLNSENEDRLSLLYKQTVENQAKDVEASVANKRLSEIFEFENSDQFDVNFPGANMNFLKRLIHQITRPASPTLDDLSDEEFTEINQNEITAVINEESYLNEESFNHNKLTRENSLVDKVRSFLEELFEETDVIRGTIDNDTLFNRRSRRAKFSDASFTNNNKMFVAQTAF